MLVRVVLCDSRLTGVRAVESNVAFLFAWNDDDVVLLSAREQFPQIKCRNLRLSLTLKKPYSNGLTQLLKRASVSAKTYTRSGIAYAKNL